LAKVEGKLSIQRCDSRISEAGNVYASGYGYLAGERGNNLMVSIIVFGELAPKLAGRTGEFVISGTLSGGAKRQDGSGYYPPSLAIDRAASEADLLAAFAGNSAQQVPAAVVVNGN
jgi:hypothetical protein